MAQPVSKTLQEIYQRLLKQFGPQFWWPADTKLEVIAGAILTQNTNWGNVEKALQNLKKQKFLNTVALHKISLKELAAMIKPAGYFNVKAKRLKNFISFFWREYSGDFNKMGREDLGQLREKLLAVNGIGPETADSILLYALDKPIFVVDAYTKRFLYRHNFVKVDETYHGVQEKFMHFLKNDAQLFNEYHALIVRLGKDFCRPSPRCEQCPLKNFHYSLIYKCQSCHRVLPQEKNRFVSKEENNRFLCSDCHPGG